jgi:transposase
MSLKLNPIGDIPVETKAIAQAIFPKGNGYMRMRDELGTFYTDEDFAGLYAAVGQPAEAPWRLALVTVMQFAEDLTDRQAAEAVRTRIDWKYALGLNLNDQGFHFSVLNDFRERLLKGGAEDLLLNKMLTVFQAQGWLKAGQRQRTDSTHVLAAVRALSRIEMVGETLRHALNVLATVLPDWLEDLVSSDWYERYGHSFETYRMPKAAADLLVLAEQIGRDGWHILGCVQRQRAWPWLRFLPALVTLDTVWKQQYECEADRVRWRSKEELPANADRICTPYDPEARYSRKRETAWTGFKVHLTETCEADCPHLITQVETAPATQPDGDALEPIQTDLAQRNLLPDQQIVDTGYAISLNLVSSQAQHVDLLGPVNLDSSWQAQTPGGLDLSQFRIDWDAQTVTCPADKTNVLWRDQVTPAGTQVIQVRFARQDCLTCPLRCRCTTNVHGSRSLTLPPYAQYLALQQARQRQTTEAFKTAYRIRAGIEGSLSQAVQVSDMRHARYRGLLKTHFQHLATAAALNLIRSIAWLWELPFAKTRISRFAALGTLAA